MKRALYILGLVVLGLVSFTATSFAASGAETASDSLADLAKPVLDAVMSGQGFYAAALTLVLAVALMRRYAPKWAPKAFGWVATDAGGVLTSFLMSFAGAMATTLAGGDSPSLGMAKSAVGVALAASGGYVALKKLIAPALRAVQTKAPAWAKPIIGFLIWVAERPDAISKSIAAGDKAVAAKPSTGATGVTGPAREIK